MENFRTYNVDCEKSWMNIWNYKIKKKISIYSITKEVDSRIHMENFKIYYETVDHEKHWMNIWNYKIRKYRSIRKFSKLIMKISTTRKNRILKNLYTFNNLWSWFQNPYGNFQNLFVLWKCRKREKLNEYIKLQN